MLSEQYLPNISDPVYLVHQSFMWILWLNWRKSTFHPVTAPNDSKCWPIVTSLIQELATSNCDVTMTDCSRVVAMDAFLAQWNRKFITAQWWTENTSCFNFFVYFFLILYPPNSMFQHEALLVSINVIPNLPKLTSNKIVHTIHRKTINPANQPAFRPDKEIEYE